MTGWEQDVVTKRWRPSAPRAEPLGRRERRRGGEPRGRLPATLLAVDDTCWSCRAPVRAIVGVLVDRALTEDRSGFLALADVDRILLAVRRRGRAGRARNRRAAPPPQPRRPGRLRLQRLPGVRRAGRPLPRGRPAGRAPRASAARWPISRSTSPWTCWATGSGAGRRACGRTGAVPNAMRSFDPRRVGRLECAAWVTYYRREWLKFLRARRRPHAPHVRAAVARDRCAAPGSCCAPTSSGRRTPTTIPTARGAAWSASTGSWPHATARRFDVARAAWLEVEWWRVHRDVQRREIGDEEALADALAALYAHVYAVAPTDVRGAAAAARAGHAPLRSLGAGGLRPREPARARGARGARALLRGPPRRGPPILSAGGGAPRPLRPSCAGYVRAGCRAIRPRSACVR